MPKGWIGKPSPKSKHTGTGWFGEMDRCYVDEKQRYCVMIRTVDTDWGKVEHMCMRNAGSFDIPWSEMQRIKNEIFGEERTAIEVFPKESQLIDEANMYHLWVLPEKFVLPFGIHEIKKTTFTQWYKLTYNEDWTNKHAFLNSLGDDYEKWCADHGQNSAWDA